MTYEVFLHLNDNHYFSIRINKLSAFTIAEAVHELIQAALQSPFVPQNVKSVLRKVHVPDVVMELKKDKYCVISENIQFEVTEQ